MKSQNNPAITAISESFDRLLLDLLSSELNILKAAKNKNIKEIGPDADEGLMVA